MKISERHIAFASARFMIADAVTRAVEAHQLTHAELMLIIAGEMTAWVGMEVRDERKVEETELEEA